MHFAHNNILSLEIEKQAIKKEKDELSKSRLDEIERELVKLKGEEAKLKEAWQHEKRINDSIKSKKKELENAKFTLQQA